MKKRMGIINIATMYLGAVLGAGFCSGRECWQFFGIFGRKGYVGALCATLGFILLALMLTYIARSKNSSDLGDLICPVKNEALTAAVGYVLAGIYYTLIISMSAAGGSLLHQELGLPAPVGGLIIVCMTLVTVFGNFERLSSIIGKVMPLAFGMALLTILLVMMAGSFHQSGRTSGYEPSEMAPVWWVSGIVFAAYNSMGFISVAGNCALQARSRKVAYVGAFLGTLLLGGMTVLLLHVLLKDMAYSASLDLPMLGYARHLSHFLNAAYGVVLYCSIYATAVTTFYGFSTKLPDNPGKKKVLLIAALAGFGIGLSGFKTLVAYLYPLQGYIGIAFILLIVLNFFVERQKNSQNQHISSNE